MRTGNGVVSEVLTVNLTVDGGSLQRIQIFKAEDCTGAIREEVITRIGIHAGTHIRQDADIGQTVLGGVETDTVCRQTHGHAVLVKRVLQSHLKVGGGTVGTFVFGQFMVVIQLLVGVERAISLNLFLTACNLVVRCGGVEDINCHLLGNRECSLQLVDLSLGGQKRGVLENEISSKLLVFKGRGGDLLCHNGENVLLKSVAADHTRHQHTGLFTTHRILNTYTVFDVLYLNLATDSGLGVGIEVFFGVVIGVLYNNLRQKLPFLGGTCRGLGNVVGVGKEDLTGSKIHRSNLTRFGLNPQLVSVLLQLERHGRKLFLGRFELVARLADGVTEFVLFVGRGKRGLLGCRRIHIDHRQTGK